MGGGLKVPVVDRAKQYTIYYEGLQTPIGLMTFVHCDIHTKWTKDIKRQLKADFGWLIEARQQPLHCLRHNKKQEKFIRMFGFQFSYEMPEHGIDVYTLEIE